MEELLQRRVRIHILLGGITAEEFKQNFRSLFLPNYTLFEDIEIRFTPSLTNNFDVIDKEKVILKISNPVDPNEIFGMIYLWQRLFAEKMHKKFFDLWDGAEKLEITIS
ncbi:MAG: hypothetical protein ACFFCW_31790 [Candidatus Hodarchaeota archaeon]